MTNSSKQYSPDGLQSFGSRVIEWLRTNEFIAITAGVVLVLGFVLSAVIAMTLSSRQSRSLNELYKAQGDVAALDNVLANHATGRTRPFILVELAATAMRRPAGDRAESEGELSARLDKAADALVELTERYRRHAVHFPAQMMLGAVREEQRDYDTAHAIYRGALEAAPTAFEPLIRYHIGRMLVLLDRPDEAVPHLQEALAQASPTVFIPYMGRLLEESAIWYENAEHLLANIGVADKYVRLPEPRPAADVETEPEAGQSDQVD